MSKMKLFDEDSEEETNLKTNNEYAKKYDAWREKEEIHKLEQKYGNKVLNSDGEVSSDSEDESDEPPEISEETEAQFLKTLAMLKTKDPRIYDPQFKFFDEKEKEAEKETKTKQLTFADSDEDDDDGDIFSIEKKAEIDDMPQSKTDSKQAKNAPKEGKIKEFLTGKVEHIDQEVEKDLAPLKALWSDPKISEGEAFLRDYILNKRYLDEGDAGEAEDKLRDDEDLEADEQMVEEQGKFERAYNFRFEEPDDEYLKRFPRTMNSIRPKDNSRARKRAEVRTRKEEEKQRKMEEIARLKALKLKEIQEKLAKIKEVTGNEELAFKDEDIEGEFDPEEHDRRMKAIFDEQYYGDADDEKPVFPDLDEELEIENWENYEPEHEPSAQTEELHCEDEDFNMDADYDPKQARTNLLEELQKNLGKKRRNRKKKSKLAELLTTEKPTYVPTVADKTYDQYMEEYYKMDCEDVIGGDLPTRFKYRQVVPNDYGLTVEEILLADDKELTQWVPLKKIVKHRPENVEKSEVKTYAQKAADVGLKKKMLPSLFKELPEEPEVVVPVAEPTKKKKKKKNKHKSTEETNVENNDETVGNNEENTEKSEENAESNARNGEEVDNVQNVPKKKKKKHKNKETNINGDQSITDDNLSKENDKVEVTENIESSVQNTESKKKKKKNKNKDGFIVEAVKHAEPSQHDSNNTKDKQKLSETDNQVKDLKRKLESTSENHPKKKRKKNKNKVENNTPTKGEPSNTPNKNKKDFKMKFKAKDRMKKGDASSDNPLNKLSDERLKAYGLNPKKYRSFLKYKKF